MLPRFPIDSSASITFSKYTADGRDATRLGAFPKGEILRFTVTCPRTLGASAVVLRLWRDGCAERDTPFEFTSGDVSTLTDTYELTVNTADLCGETPSGLFYYRLLFVRRGDTLFSDSINNVDFDLVARDGAPFRLLIHEVDYAAPAWFGEGVMYHVFVDRFAKGEGGTIRRLGERAPEINPDWEGGDSPVPRLSRGASDQSYSLRRQPVGRGREAGLSGFSGGQGHLPQSHFRGLLQPQVRHG